MLQANFSYYLLGERAAVMQSCSDQIDANCQRLIWGIAQHLREMGCCLDIVPGMNNLTAIFDPQQHNPQAMLETLQTLASSTDPSHFQTREIHIPVIYGGEYGPDLEVVAQHCRLSPNEVIAQHSAASYLVFFLGFQPGFAYLGGLPPSLATPRRSDPRLQVAAGSVGIGGGQTGVYPAVSPGGWQLIGRTSLSLFNPAHTPPTLLQRGDLVRFVVERSYA
ncbi:MAG: 5-oxoprolinase subunit PxpB [Candidatus Aquirickettsiella gammari]